MRLGGRLFQQFVVDAYSVIENTRLNWIRHNQTKLRSEVYHNLVDLLSKGDAVNESGVGQPYILPASFVGSARYMHQNFLDSLAVCRNIGYPTIFLTMTCNSLWDEIRQMMAFIPLSSPEDCPDIIARVFKLKLDQIYDEIKNKSFFGECISGQTLLSNFIEIVLYICLC